MSSAVGQTLVFDSAENQTQTGSLCYSPFFLIWSSQSFWGARLADEAGEHDDRNDVRKHQDKLNRDVFARGKFSHTLHLSCQRIGKSEQQTREHCLHRTPFSKNQRRQRDEATAG